MNIEMLGPGVRIQADRSSIYLTAQELLDLMDWTRDHELELQIKALEADQARRRQLEDNEGKPQ